MLSLISGDLSCYDEGYPPHSPRCRRLHDMRGPQINTTLLESLPIRLSGSLHYVFATFCNFLLIYHTAIETSRGAVRSTGGKEGRQRRQAMSTKPSSRQPNRTDPVQRTQRRHGARVKVHSGVSYVNHW